MSEKKLENVDLGVLETRVDDLIRTVDALKNENSALRHQQKNLISERAVLIEKTEQARFRIESMIARLQGYGNPHMIQDQAGSRIDSWQGIPDILS